MTATYWIQTLGCPKNEVDSDKIIGSLISDGYVAASSAAEADLVVVNTCAFIDQARVESIETILDLAGGRKDGSRLVVTGCLAARSGDELAAAIPEIDLVADVGVPVQLRTKMRFERASPEMSLSLMELARPPAGAPWAYVRVAEGCDRACGFCAIPTFRGAQRSRSLSSVLDEVERLDAKEIILVSQDLASYGRDLGVDAGLVHLVREVAQRTQRVRLLYLYPSSLTDRLISTILETGVPYFDLSLQHVSRTHLRRMRRWGSGDRFMERIQRIRDLEPTAAFRSNFIIGYPGETEEDHDELLHFLEEASLDWVGLFAYSEEEGTYAAGRSDIVPRELALERLREASEIADLVSSRVRTRLIGSTQDVLVDSPGIARSHREAPDIDGVIRVDDSLLVGETVSVRIAEVEGPDLIAAGVS